MKRSAGLLLYRRKNDLEVLLVHPGGPFWAKKDVWGIPKGLYEEDEDALAAARREFEEEIGQAPPEGEPFDLGEIKINGKIITAWAVEGDLDVSEIKSNTFMMEWPPRSGQQIEIPEVDKAAWLPAPKAMTKMHKGQEIFIERLQEHLGLESEKAEPDMASQSSLF